MQNQKKIHHHFHQAWRIQVAITSDMMRCPRDCGLSCITRGNHPRNRGITEDGTAQYIRCSVLFAVVFGRYKTCTVGVVGVVSSRIRKGSCAPQEENQAHRKPFFLLFLLRKPKVLLFPSLDPKASQSTTMNSSNAVSNPMGVVLTCDTVVVYSSSA